MNADDFDTALFVYCRRRPFRKFIIEFNSGAQVPIKHPEAIRRHGISYVLRATDRGFSVFVPESVTRLLDIPATTTV